MTSGASQLGWVARLTSSVVFVVVIVASLGANAAPASAAASLASNADPAGEYDGSVAISIATTVSASDQGTQLIQAHSSDVGYDNTTASTVATNTLGAVSDDALAYATRVEKLDHIFVPKHNLDALVTQLGSREAVVEQMLRGVSGRTPTAGVFELTTAIEGQAVVVRGAVVDGVVKIGTAFTP